MRTKIIVGMAITLMILIVVSFAQKSKDKETGKNEALSLSVKIQVVQEASIKKSLNVSGTLEGENEAVVISETSGKITAVKAKVGDWLTKGQLIVQVENDLQEAALLQAKAQVLAAQTSYEKAMADLKRFEDLFNQKITTQSDIENARLGAKAAEAQLKGAEAGLKQAQKQFDNTFIKAPLRGRLADRYVEEATMITPGTMIAVVVNSRNIKLKSSVAENEVTLIGNHAAATLSADAVPGKTFNGLVTSIAQKANNERTYPIEIIVENDKDELLKSGMFGRAIVEVAKAEKTIVIPSASVLTDEQKSHYVFVESAGLAKRVNIQLGLEQDGHLQVISGLAFGDRLVIAGQQNLTDGAKVTVE